jgi:hypothetical protein
MGTQCLLSLCLLMTFHGGYEFHKQTSKLFFYPPLFTVNPACYSRFFLLFVDGLGILAGDVAPGRQVRVFEDGERFKSGHLICNPLPEVNVGNMKLKAKVQYLGKRAYYEIAPEAGGIYQARLLRYEGGDWVTPPPCITLVKSVRRWAGSHEERPLLEALGRVIDRRVRGSNPHDI